MNEQAGNPPPGLAKKPPVASVIEVVVAIGGRLQPRIHMAEVEPGAIVIWKATGVTGFELQFDALVPGLQGVQPARETGAIEDFSAATPLGSEGVFSGTDQVIVLQAPDGAEHYGTYYYDLLPPGSSTQDAVQQSQHGVRSYAIIIRPPLQDQ